LFFTAVFRAARQDTVVLEEGKIPLPLRTRTPLLQKKRMPLP
jgi:hypothetical protein